MAESIGFTLLEKAQESKYIPEVLTLKDKNLKLRVDRSSLEKQLEDLMREDKPINGLLKSIANAETNWLYILSNSWLFPFNFIFALYFLVSESVHASIVYSESPADKWLSLSMLLLKKLQLSSSVLVAQNISKNIMQILDFYQWNSSPLLSIGSESPHSYLFAPSFSFVPSAHLLTCNPLSLDSRWSLLLAVFFQILMSIRSTEVSFCSCFSINLDLFELSSFSLSLKQSRFSLSQQKEFWLCCFMEGFYPGFAWFWCTFSQVGSAEVWN
jgi:hypothetical protein